MITLTSDFGLKDPYVAEMKAVILSICPSVSIIDVTHLIDKWKVSMGAFVLACVTTFFPQGTIHVAVVDPGVGTQRRPIVVETKWNLFVGPDNGLLILAAEAQGLKQVRAIECRNLMQQQVSETFHGRDIFAPIAAHLANGVALEEIGPQITDFVQPGFASIKRTPKFLLGEVLHIDDFGNIVTNVHGVELSDSEGTLFQIALNSTKLQGINLSRTYADAKTGEPVLLVGSHGYIEISLNQGNAAAKFGVKEGDQISIFRT